MADLKITQLRAITEPEVSAGDVFALADISASETRKVTVSAVAESGLRLLPNGSIDWAKIDPATFSLAPGSITTSLVGDFQITHDKLALDAVESDNVADNAIHLEHIDAGAFARGISKSGVNIGHANTPVTAGSFAGFTYDEYGHITAVSAVIPSTDLPLATSTTVGAVSISSTGGLSVTGTGAVVHSNTITPNTTGALKVTYDQYGHINGSLPIAAGDLVLATSTSVGAVSVPSTGKLEVDGSGAITHSSSLVAPGTYTKAEVDQFGHVINGLSLTAADIPSLSASQITSGTFSSALIAPRSVTQPKLADYSIAYIQEADPVAKGGDHHIGMLWFQESTAQLSMWNGNSWFPIGQARLTAENLRYCGTVDADTNSITGVTKFGTGAGYSIGDTPKIATDAQIGVYFVVNNPGSNIALVPATAFDNGDWLLCNGAVAGTGWERIDTLSGGGGGGATSLDDLLDVALNAPTAGQYLQLNAKGLWVNVAGPAAPGLTAPALPIDGQTWVDTSVDPPVVKVYDQTSTTWVDVGFTPSDASESVKGIIQLATAAEVLTGTDAVKAVTPKQAADHYIAKDVSKLPALP